MTHPTRLLATVAVMTAFAACDDATGTVAGEGQVEVEAVGDAGNPSSEAPDDPNNTSGTAEGTVQFDARVYLRTDTGGWIEVTNAAAQSASVDASGRGNATSFTSAELDARGYTHVRVVFEQVRANVTGGVTVGLGQALLGEVTVGAAGSTEPVVVEREVDLRVSGGGTSRIIIDLNADAWLARADAETRTVSRTDFESAVGIFAQS